MSRERLQQLAINDQGFVFDPSTGEAYTVNPTGLFILRKLQQQQSVEEIADQMKEEFDQLPDDLVRDIHDFQEHLQTFKLV